MSKRRYFDLGCLLSMGIFVAVFVYPMFSQAKAKATNEACLCNCKQLVLSLHQYIADWDDRLPNMLHWYAATFPYCKNTDIYRCQQDRRCPWGYSMGGGDGHTDLDFISYDMLQRWSYQKFPPDPQAARDILLYEVGREGLDYRHFGGMHIGFLDGHVKYYSREQMPPNLILGGKLLKARP